MLFDLRSRGRRRTVQVVYIGLAILIGAGLVLFGVGTGSGGGGLFGGLDSNSTSHSGNGALNAQTRQALTQTKKNPNDAAAWSSLVDARFSAANANATATAYTSTGLQQLNLLAQAYERYTKLTSAPSTSTATIAGEAYTALGQYANASAAYQAVLAAQPNDANASQCVAINSYAAGNTRVAQLAQAKFLATQPKAQRKAQATALEQAKTDKTVPDQYCSALQGSG